MLRLLSLSAGWVASDGMGNSCTARHTTAPSYEQNLAELFSSLHKLHETELFLRRRSSPKQQITHVWRHQLFIAACISVI